MRLETLGGLAVKDVAMRREKPLLLAAYLALEGPQPRRALAALFYPEASDAMNSLAVSIGKLRRLDLVEADDAHAWMTADCDALELSLALRGRDLERACAIYCGSFAAGVSAALDAELETWVLETRERFSAEVGLAWLTRAEREAARGHFGVAAEWAVHALGVSDSTPELLIRAHGLLLAAEHPARLGLERRATAEFDLTLERDASAMRGRLRQTLVGREAELERFDALRPGEWGWLSGATGMGKTAVLRELERRGRWRLLPARQGLAFATLEPLAPNWQGHPDGLLRHLAGLEQDLLLDDWASIDPESAALLERLRLLRPSIRVVIADLGLPPFPVEQHLTLQPLTESTLAGVPGAYAATQGLPNLVGSWLRGEPLLAALEDRLARCSAVEQRVYMALCLLETPARTLIRSGLGLSAAELGCAWQTLLEGGLIEVSGEPRARDLGRQSLRRQASLEAELALGLARQLPPEDSFRLYQCARGLWTPEDLAAVQLAYREWGQTLLDRGLPNRALELLSDAPEDEAIRLLRARALERSAQYEAGLAVVRRCSSLEAAALEAKLLWRVGDAAQAELLATRALAGSMMARAEALNTLGQIARAAGDLRLALERHGRAATLWRGLGADHLHAQALINLATCQIELGEEPHEALDQSERLSAGNAMMHTCIHTNRATFHLRNGRLEEAAHAFRRATESDVDAGSLIPLATAWMNLGVIHHMREQRALAQSAYHRSLELADRGGDRFLRANLLANLAELNEDPPAWEEAIHLLESGGWHDAANYHRGVLTAFRLRSSPLGKLESPPMTG